MPAPLYEDTPFQRLADHKRSIEGLKRRTSGGAAAATWAPVTLLNGWLAAGDPFFATAHRSDKLVESDDDFRGTLDATGATSGTVAFEVDSANWPEADFSFLMDLDTGGGTFTIGRVVVSSTTGEVTVYFP